MCRHLLEFQNEAWSSLDQLNGGCDPPPIFFSSPFDFEYLALLQVYTFFWWRLEIINVKIFIAEALHFSSYHNMPTETDLSNVATVNITISPCRQLQCAIICEHYIKENHICIGYTVAPLSNAEVCQCSLLVTHGNGATVPFGGKVYINSGKS